MSEEAGHDRASGNSSMERKQFAEAVGGQGTDEERELQLIESDCDRCNWAEGSQSVFIRILQQSLSVHRNCQDPLADETDQLISELAQ